jgi:pyruvate-ferredoxin/flavodoxin oxidoreductase
MERRMITVDANEAVASVAHRTNEVIVIYPITPSSPMGEWCDEWSANGKTNIWGSVPDVTEMQSEAGAIAAIHGALQAGSLATADQQPVAEQLGQQLQVGGLTAAAAGAAVLEEG